MTTENEVYGTGWLKCARCGLVAPAVKREKKDDPPRCVSVVTCDKVEKSLPFGGPVWGPSTPNVPALDEADHKAIADAMEARARKAAAPELTNGELHLPVDEKT